MFVHVAVNNQKKYGCMLCFFVNSFLIASSTQIQALEYSVTPHINHFYYQEFDESGDELLNEVGPLYGLELSLKGSLGGMKGGRIHSGLEVSYLAGEVDYYGRTQAGNTYDTKTQQNIIQYGASIGYQYPINGIAENTFLIQPDLKLLAYHWRRNIQGRQQVSDLVEDYNGFIIQPSFILSYSDYQFQLGLTRTLRNTMTIQPSSCIDRVTVKPKSENSWFTQGEYRMFKNEIYTASIRASYKSYKMNASDIETGNTCFGPVGWHEPENSMQLWQLGMVLTF